MSIFHHSTQSEFQLDTNLSSRCHWTRTICQNHTASWKLPVPWCRSSNDHYQLFHCGQRFLKVRSISILLAVWESSVILLLNKILPLSQHYSDGPFKPFFSVEIFLGLLMHINFLFEYLEIIQLNSNYPVKIDFKSLKIHHIIW